jgi:quinol monooxygenase YgiN
MPSTPLTILAQITAQPGKEAFLLEALKKLVAPTLNEAGCLFYDLHTDNNTPGVFVFYEAWETREHWLAHNDSAHIAAHRIATEGTVLGMTLNELTKLA